MKLLLENNASDSAGMLMYRLSNEKIYDEPKETKKINKRCT